MIQLKKRDAAAAVLAPKVTGARILARVFRDQPPDFMVLCSSLAGIVGGVGQVDYCAANAYLDSFASQYATLRPPWMTLPSARSSPFSAVIGRR